MIRHRLLAGGGLAVIFLVIPARARAHGIGGRVDLPVPLEFFIVGAASVLILSFVALAVLWPAPRLQDGPRFVTSRLLGPTFTVLGIVGFLALVQVIGQLMVPALGLPIEPSRPTVAPVTVWVLFWLVVPFAAALIGDWYTDLNPWRALARTVGLGRFERIGLIDSLGVWPAALVFFAFTWLELVDPRSGDPVILGLAALVYTLFLVSAMAYAGRETGLAVFDAFTPYNRLISAIAPWGRDPEGKIAWRGWLRSLPSLPDWPGLWFFVVVMIGTVSYDGASGATWFQDLAGPVQTTMPGRTLLLAGSVGIIAGAYWLASVLAARLGEGRLSPGEVAARFAHTLVPIALAYAVAHYGTLVIFEGQQLIAALSDPFGLGWDLFGTADRRIDFFITGIEPVWYFQVLSIVGGHLLGVVLAHDRALADFGAGAVRSQYAMLVLMVALTTLGLLILAG